MTYIDELLQMNYDEVVLSLIKKYGKVTGDYFSKPTCLSANRKIKRTSEGLLIHHIDEDKAIMLSTPAHARENPFDYQKADRLVYCNLLEHLVLHIKIFEYPNANKNKKEICGVGGIYNFMVPQLNDIYEGTVYKRPWQQKIADVVLPLKQEYFKCIKYLVNIGFNEDYPLLSSMVDIIEYCKNSKAHNDPELAKKEWQEKVKNKKIYKELIAIGVTQ